MGHTRWDPPAFTAFTATHTAGKSRASVFTARGMDADLDPKGITVRESRDSLTNPNSLAIGLFCDVTGSMGHTAEAMIRTQLDTTQREIHARLPQYDPHILVGAIGDTNCDSAPLQVSQFEGGIEVADQLRRIYLEGGGGGNFGESYLAAHYFMGMRTSIDCWEKRRRRGVFFTMGDEPALGTLSKSHLREFFGVDSERDLTAKECLGIAQRQYDVFHIVLADTGHARMYLDGVMRTWTPLMGERALVLRDHTKVAELVVSTIQVLNGADVKSVAASWSGSTAVAVAGALSGMGALAKGNGTSKGVTRFA